MMIRRVIIMGQRRYASSATASSSNALRIGICGGGTVGGGVVEMLKSRKREFDRLGCEMVISKMLVRDVNKARDFELPDSCVLTSNPSEILDDPNIDCVVELVGGTDIAKDITFGALERGKHVVSANKAYVYIRNICQLYLRRMLLRHKSAASR